MGKYGWSLPVSASSYAGNIDFGIWLIHAAMLGIFSEPGRVPLEVFAQQSGNESYLGAVEIISRFDEDATSRAASLPERTHEAILAVGGSQADTAWRFPLRPAEIARSHKAILNSWNEANDGKATELLEEHLVRRIRTWRPEVILTEDLSPRGENRNTTRVNTTH